MTKTARYEDTKEVKSAPNLNKSTEPSLEERVKSRFMLGQTDFDKVGTDREKIAAHLVEHTRVDQSEAQRQVDEFFDGRSAKKVK